MKQPVRNTSPRTTSDQYLQFGDTQQITRTPAATISVCNRRTIPRDVQAVDSVELHRSPHVEQLNIENAPVRISALIDIADEQEQELDLDPQKLRRQLMDLGKAVVADDKIELQREHLPAFYAARKKAIETGDYTDARTCLFHVLGYNEEKQAAMVAGFKQAGTVYSMRGSLGSIVNLTPAAMTVMAHGAAPVAARNWAIGRLVASIGCAIGGGVVNIYALMHLLACHDLSFRQAPDVQPELKTKQFDEIQKDLNLLLGDVEKRIEEIKAALQVSLQDPESLELKENVNKLFKDTQEMIGSGIHTYLTRCQLNHVFFRGLSSQSLLATCKLYTNLASSWIGVIAGDPRMSALTQLAGCVVQLVGNYLIGASDKVTEQFEMIDLKILTADSEEKLKQIMRSPLKIRAFMLEQLFTGQIKELDQEISSMLGLADPNQWRQYATLKERGEYPDKLHEFQQLKDHALNQLSSSVQDKIQSLESDLAKKTKERDHEHAEILFEEIANKLGMSADTYKKYSRLQAQADGVPVLSLEERDTLNELSRQILTARERLAPDTRSKFEHLLASWEETRHDPLHVKERRFTEVSSFKMNNQTVRAGMRVSDNARTGLFELAPEFKIGLWKDGKRRSKAPDEMTANYAATSWKTWQWVIGGTYGAVMLNAFLGLLAAQQKTKDPKYEEPLWQRGMSTGLVGIALLVNMVAAYRIISASAKPLNNTLRLQMLAGTSGSGMDGTIQNRKLKLRDNLRTDIQNGAFPYVGLNHKQWSHYIFAAVRASLPGMFAMLQESKHSAAAHAAYDQVISKRDELVNLQSRAELQDNTNIPDAVNTNSIRLHDETTKVNTDAYIEMRDSDE